MSQQTEFQLECGRFIRLKSIDQWGTYSGLLEGIPTKEMNARTIERTLRTAEQRHHFKPHLIDPTETPIQIDRDYPFGTPASIPTITCVASFDCFDAIRDESKDGSTLPIVWFQSDFAFPIESDIVESIIRLPWDDLATNFDY